MRVNNYVDVKDIAEYFIFKSNFDNKRQQTISPLKLQKLIYYAQAWYATLNNGEKLFDEDIEAWVHGPVVPSIYHEYKHFGYNYITSNTQGPSQEIEKNSNFTNTLNLVWDLYGEFDAKTLEKMTHSETPWQEARKGISPYEASNNIISIDSMKNYYKKYLIKS